MSIRGKLAVTLAALAIAATAAAPSVQAAGIGGLARHSATTFKPMREGRNVLAPFAFIRFCASNPADCRGSREARVSWTGLHSTVAGVNRRVNSSIRPVNDRTEEWRASVKAGDCEDFALTKRRALLAAGLPASALRIAVATTRQGEGHAVLVVKSDAGDFVLDNRHDRIVNWDRTDLRFSKITSAENPKLWRRIG